ncbi:hypothetical protein [Methylocucumis oryzae]|uniref:Uncharacterized protein n=1 Tax=Methylocucumis oryzae TaxID=1632867 RepID=A0A0F3IG08_9GAMM|nr:hypothetical protein [Methylocucumis oryzae]KJV05612.1 hypothetical protein VZ94_16870 [Methylocucumis oryzae]
MGMFDSFYIEVDGHEQELQSKRFDCILNHYRLGDWVSGSLPGIRVYFDHLCLDDTGKLVYRIEAECVRKRTVFIVLAQGVFVDFQVHKGELSASAISPVLSALRERWLDSARFQGFLVEILRAQQQKIALLENRLDRVQAIITNARRLKAGEKLDGILGLLHEHDKKLAAGEEPLDVIAWALGDETSMGGLWLGDANLDPLEEYRL